MPMKPEELPEAGWTILNKAATVSKPLLWLRDTDSALPLGPKLIDNLRVALRTVADFPNSVTALCAKMAAIYQRALDEPWVGIGAQERSTRLGRRTAQFGLMYAVEYARSMQPQFNGRAQRIKEQPANPQLAWEALFTLVDEFINYLDWGEFVTENPRGQASNLVLEAIELLEAIHLDAAKIPEETGDVFYNLLAFCRSLRIRSCDVFPVAPNLDGNPDYREVLNNPERIAHFINGRIDSKLAWYRQNREKYHGRTWETWQQRVLDVLYQDNLEIDVRRDGTVLCEEGNLLIIEWRCPCPVLDHCQRLGCSTKDVCSTLYHVQYQALLSLLVPGAFFARDYSQLRPNGDACVEVIIRRPDVEELCAEQQA